MHDEPRVSIERTAISFETLDGLTLRGVRAIGPGRPKASVIVAHGYGEHGGRYEDLLTVLAASRFASYAVDHRGHGQSDGERAFEPDFGRYLDDFGLVVKRARAEHTGKPCYLIGHSLGGLIAFGYALDHQADLDGVVLLAPALRYRAKLNQPTNTFLRRLADKSPHRPLIAYVPGLRSKKRGAEMEALRDPLNYKGWIRAGTIVSIQDAGEVALERAGEFKLPILIMHGDQDLIIDPAASFDLYRAIGVRTDADNSLITWPGMRHELLHDVDGKEVIGVILGWLNGHYTEWRKANPSGTAVKPVSP